MKRSIKRLPKRTQEELNTLLGLITQNIHHCGMVVLFGSYARGGYVLWDEKVEFGVHTSYQSDYDILVILSKKAKSKDIENILRKKVTAKYHKIFGDSRHASPQFVVEYVDKLNKQLERGQYFFTDIVKEGIKIYDTKEFKLAKPRDLSFQEIKEFANAEFENHYPESVNFLKHANIDFADKMYKSGSFQLHQACERFYHTINLVFTNYHQKSHKLDELGGMVKKYARDFATIFPLNTDFEKQCFDLLCRAYIEARYNKDFVVTKEELAYLLERTELLKAITLRICQEQIAYYDTLIETKK